MKRAGFDPCRPREPTFRPGDRAQGDRRGFNLWRRPCVDSQPEALRLRRVLEGEPFLVVAVGRAEGADWALVVDLTGRLGWIMLRALVRP